MTDYRQTEDYWKNYQKSVDELKNNPEVVELDKLCYHVFKASKDGEKLLETFENRFVKPSLVQPNAQNYQTLLTFYEGFKEAFRMIKNSIESHEQRIKANDEEKQNG